MGFSSYDDFINQTTSNNKTNQWYFQKVSSNAGASTAGRWHEFLTANGIPSAVSFSGSAGVATSLSSSTAGAMTLIEGNVGPNTRHLTNMMAWTNSTTVSPASLILCDFLLYYPACVVTGSPTALNNSTTLPRYADGKGVMAIIMESGTDSIRCSFSGSYFNLYSHQFSRNYIFSIGNSHITRKLSSNINSIC